MLGLSTQQTTISNIITKVVLFAMMVACIVAVQSSVASAALPTNFSYTNYTGTWATCGANGQTQTVFNGTTVTCTAPPTSGGTATNTTNIYTNLGNSGTGTRNCTMTINGVVYPC